MDEAYLFEIGAPSDKEKLRKTKAEIVNLSTDYHRLFRAANRKHLRCTYCFEPVKLVRVEAGKPALRCFAHYAWTQDVPDCRLRSDSPSGQGGSGSTEDYYNPRKVTEHFLYLELTRIFSANPEVKITESDPKEKEPRIQIEGPSVSLLIYCLAPGDEGTRSRNFDGKEDGKQILFFIDSKDVPALSSQTVNEKFLSVRPAILINLTSPNQQHEYALLSELSAQSAKSPREPLASLNLIYVDYKQLLGFSRASEFLFIKERYKPAVGHIEKQLDRHDLPEIKKNLLRLLAKRLLVDGAAAHKAVFKQTQREAQRFFIACSTFPEKDQLISFDEFHQLKGDPSIPSLFTDQPLVRSLYEEFFQDAINAMHSRINEMQNEMALSQRSWENKEQRLKNELQEKKDLLEETIFSKELTEIELKKIAEELRREGEAHKVNRSKWETETAEMRSQLQRKEKALNELKNQLQKQEGDLQKKEAALDEERRRRAKVENDFQLLNAHPLSHLLKKVIPRWSKN